MALLAVLVTTPAFPGIAVKTKAVLSGRRGAPVLQLYYDLAKLLRKHAVYSATTTWIFRAGPVLMLAALLVASLFLPLNGIESVVRFEGDLLAFTGLLALARFALEYVGNVGPEELRSRVERRRNREARVLMDYIKGDLALREVQPPEAERLLEELRKTVRAAQQEQTG